MKRRSLTLVLLLFLLGLISSIGLSAQSLEQLVLALPADCHTLGDEAVAKRIFELPIGIRSSEVGEYDSSLDETSTSPGSTLATQIFEECDYRVTARSESALSLAWDDGTAITFVRLPLRGGDDRLLLVRSATTPFAISTLSLYDAQGAQVKEPMGLPSLSADLFLDEKASPDERRILASLPLKMSWNDDRRELIVRLAPEGNLAPTERHLVSEEYFARELRFRWRKGTFQVVK